jgi:hypothetical protein
VTARSKAWVCGGLLVGIAGSNSDGGIDVLFVNVVFCHIKFTASARSLLQRSPAECGVSECDMEASIMRRPWLTRGCCAMGEGVNMKACSLVHKCRCENDHIQGRRN